MSTSSVLREPSYKLHNICQINSCTLLTCYLSFVMFRITKKKQAEIFLHQENSNFFKTCVFNSHSGVAEMIFKLAPCLSNYSLYPHIFPPTFVMFDNTKKNWSKNFFHPKKICFLFNNLLFQQPHKWCKNAH